MKREGGRRGEEGVNMRSRRCEYLEKRRRQKRRRRNKYEE
jgi:hypothetical protein